MDLLRTTPHTTYTRMMRYPMGAIKLHCNPPPRLWNVTAEFIRLCTDMLVVLGRLRMGNIGKVAKSNTSGPQTGSFLKASRSRVHTHTVLVCWGMPVEV